MRIFPGVPVCDCLRNHFSKRFLGNPGRKFAGTRCRAIRPVSLLNVPECPPVESDLLMRVAGRDLPSGHRDPPPGDKGKDQNRANQDDFPKLPGFHSLGDSPSFPQIKDGITTQK
jgi:hypothetical protein